MAGQSLWLPPFAKNANGWAPKICSGIKRPALVPILQPAEDAEALDAAAGGSDNLNLHADGFKLDDFAGSGMRPSISLTKPPRVVAS